MPSAIADDVDAADVHIGFVADRQPPHGGPEVGVAEDQIGRNDTVPEDLLLVVEVVEQEVESGHPLDDPAFDMLPLRGGYYARDGVERQDAVDRAGVGIDGEGDP